MTFSRLSPHSKRTGVARRRTVAGKNTPSSRHHRLWEAIRATRDELHNWQTQVDQVDSLFRLHIQPKEEALTSEFCNVTQLLLLHFAQTTLDAAHLSLLGLWIIENLQSLHVHPFTDNERLEQLVRSWEQLIGRGGAIEHQLERLARSKAFMSKDADSTPEKTNADNSSEQNNAAATYEQYVSDDADDDVFDFGWHKSTELKSDTQFDSAQAEPIETEHDKPVQEPPNTEKAEEPVFKGDIDERVSELEDRLSVDRLFRQLARVLHPDREQDDARKAEKHLLMSQCLKARQEKDINTLLTLYCEHVGDLPDDLSDDSHSDLIQALEQQLKQLQLQLQRQRFGNAFHTLIVERYAADSHALCKNKIDQHAKSLISEIFSMQKLGKQVEHQDGLMDALLDRRAIELDKLSINELTGMN